MNCIFKIAVKDLRILFRDKTGAFFIVGFPILMGLFFGLIMGGMSSGGGGTMKIAVVDQDQSEMSGKFIELLRTNESLTLEIDQLEPARESVRKGQRVGMIVLPEGFGETAGLFWGDPPKIQLGMDPSRSAEGGMMQGFIMKAIGGLANERFQNPSAFKPLIVDGLEQLDNAQDIDPLTREAMRGFLSSVESMIDSADQLQSNEDAAQRMNSSDGMQFADIESIDVMRELDPNSQAGQLKKIRSRWDISFPQAMLWGVMGCVAGFAISIVREQTMGTMLRLQVAPITRFQILAGKALACFMTVIGVIVFMTVLGMALGMRPANYVALIAAAMSVAFCFVGIMMTFAVLGKTEQAVGGIGWVINMIMAMFGGAMIPVMFMPAFIQNLSVLSPVRWGILAIEGAIWRDFTPIEMALPCAILISVGCVGLLLGTTILNRR